MLADLAGVLVGGAVAEAAEAGCAVVATEAEVVVGLATDGDDRVAVTGQHVGLDLALGGALHAGVVAAAQPTVGGDDDVTGRLDFVATDEQRRALTRTGRGEILDDFGDLLAVRHGGLHALLGLDDA